MGLQGQTGHGHVSSQRSEDLRVQTGLYVQTDHDHLASHGSEGRDRATRPLYATREESNLPRLALDIDKQNVYQTCYFSLSLITLSSTLTIYRIMFLIITIYRILVKCLEREFLREEFLLAQSKARW